MFLENDLTPGHELENWQKGKDEILGRYIGRTMAQGDDEEINTAFKIFNGRTQAMKMESKLKKVLKDD